VTMFCRRADGYAAMGLLEHDGQPQPTPWRSSVR
jgi:hypothetical protein